MLWVRQLRSVGPRLEAPPWPPLRGAYPCVTQEPARGGIYGREVFSLHVSDDAGAHEAAFRVTGGEGQAVVLVHAVPQPFMDRRAFFAAVASLIQSMDRAADSGIPH